MADPTHAHPVSSSLFSPCPIMQSREEAGMTSRRLCFCLDLWIEFLQASTIKYGIEIAPLFLMRHRGQSTWLAPLCSLFSSERITSCAFSIHPPPKTKTERSSTAENVSEAEVWCVEELLWGLLYSACSCNSKQKWEVSSSDFSEYQVVMYSDKRKK